MKRTKAVLLIFLAALIGAVGVAPRGWAARGATSTPDGRRPESWPPLAAWRGPFFNGSTDERGLPSRWSRTENIAWTADLPGEAASTPVVAGQRVFLSGVDAAKDMLLAMCFDRTRENCSGATRWPRESVKTRAAPTPRPRR